MSEETMQLITHGATGLGGAAGVGAALKWWQGREAQNSAIQIALMSAKIDQLLVLAEKHERLGERLALVEQSQVAEHKRIDVIEERLDAMQGEWNGVERRLRRRK